MKIGIYIIVVKFEEKILINAKLNSPVEAFCIQMIFLIYLQEEFQKKFSSFVCANQFNFPKS